MRVWLDPDKLQSRNLTVGDVIRVLREQNVQMAAWQIGQPRAAKGQEFRYTLPMLGQLVGGLALCRDDASPTRRKTCRGGGY